MIHELRSRIYMVARILNSLESACKRGRHDDAAHFSSCRICGDLRFWGAQSDEVFAGTPLLQFCGVLILVSSVFVGLTAVGGGITLALGVDKFPAQWLMGRAFGSYVIPGLILAVIVGGSAAAAAVIILRKSGKGASIATVAGVLLLGWLLGEHLILPKAAFDPQFFWLEAIYIVAGLLMVLPSLVVRHAVRKRGM